jgi:hypothetical protein
MLRVGLIVWEREGHGILHPSFTVGDGLEMSTYCRTWPDEIQDEPIISGKWLHRRLHVLRSSEEFSDGTKQIARWDQVWMSCVFSA